MRTAAQRRAAYRALATDPTYRPLATWTCPVCRHGNPRAATRCVECHSMGPAWRGQAIVEMALALPVFLFAALGFIEAGMLLAEKAAQDRATAVVAEWAAEHPGEDWADIAARELPGCTVMVAEPMPGIIEAAATCHYSPRITSNMWEGLPISSQEDAAQ